MSRSLFFAMGTAFLVAAYSVLAFTGEERHYRLWYYVPAAALAGSLVADRLGKRQSVTFWQWAVDIGVALLGLARPLFGVPPVSGHAVFSLHAMMTGRSKTTVTLAIVSLLITLFAKIILWNWDRTLWPGLAGGAISGSVWKLAGAGVWKRPTGDSINQ
ncbi:hypothetical protein [Roseimicrobium gellanilyticum]|nr:hypothetical protein [Roseimicrobium gellanilyticum]